MAGLAVTSFTGCVLVCFLACVLTGGPASAQPRQIQQQNHQYDSGTVFTYYKGKWIASRLGTPPQPRYPPRSRITKDSMMVVSYIVIGGLTLLCVLLALVTPETKHLPLADSLNVSITVGEEAKSSDVIKSYPKVTDKPITENGQGEYPILTLYGKTPIDNKGFELEPENSNRNSVAP